MAACVLSASSSVPVVLGISSSSIRLIAGMVNLSVLSSGPMMAPASWAGASFGTLKPPGSALLVAVMLAPARKKDPMSATPALIMARLRIHEIMFLVLDLLTLYFFMTRGL